jgi:hypothetical protein
LRPASRPCRRWRTRPCRDLPEEQRDGLERPHGQRALRRGRRDGADHGHAADGSTVAARASGLQPRTRRGCARRSPRPAVPAVTR